MLVLGLRKEERVFVFLEDGRKITIQLLGLLSRGRDDYVKVRIGIDAPREIEIQRENATVTYRKTDEEQEKRTS